MYKGAVCVVQMAPANITDTESLVENTDDLKRDPHKPADEEQLAANRLQFVIAVHHLQEILGENDRLVDANQAALQKRHPHHSDDDDENEDLSEDQVEEFVNHLHELASAIQSLQTAINGATKKADLIKKVKKSVQGYETSVQRAVDKTTTEEPEEDDEDTRRRFPLREDITLHYMT